MIDSRYNAPIQDAFTRRMVEQGLFVFCRKLEDGTYIGLCRLAFTVGLCIGITESSMFERRYCYENIGDALFEYDHMTTGKHLPIGWIARRPATVALEEAKARPNFDVKQFWGKI